MCRVVVVLIVPVSPHRMTIATIPTNSLRVSTSGGVQPDEFGAKSARRSVRFFGERAEERFEPFTQVQPEPPWRRTLSVYIAGAARSWQVQVGRTSSPPSKDFPRGTTE